jgi:hypothetical protein
VQRHPERLEQGDGTVAKSVGHPVEKVRRPRHVLPQAAIRGAVASETDVGAKVVVALTAPLADIARDGGVDRHTLPVKGPTLHRAAELVAEYERPGEERVAYPSLVEPVQVRSANADGPHSHQGLSGPRRGVGPIEEVDFTHPGQPGYLHSYLALVTVALAVVGTRAVLAREMAVD